MTGRQSYAVSLAKRMVERGAMVKDAAALHGVAPSSIRRAMKTAGAPPLKRGRRAKPGAS